MLVERLSVSRLKLSLNNKSALAKGSIFKHAFQLNERTWKDGMQFFNMWQLMELYILQSKTVFVHHLGGLNDELSSWHLPLPFNVCGCWATIPGDRTRKKKRPTEARSLFLCLIDQLFTVVLYLFNQLVHSVIFLSSLLQVISKVLVHLNPSTPLSVKDRTSPKNIKYNIKHTNTEI